MLSKTSKLGCLSWSLQAFETCPGSVVANAVVDACKFCYARTGLYNMPDVKALRARNKEDWQSDDWVSRMVDRLSKQTHFRWFDSGDMYSVSLAEKILDVMRQTPHVKHWLPTRMHKFEKFKPVLFDMMQLPHVCVRLSSDSVTGETIVAPNSSTITPISGMGIGYECPAYKQGGKCLSCRACWDKSVSVVSYPYHGRSLAKVIKIVKAA
jgi:hypothetical protein